MDPKLELLLEAERRGIQLPPEKAALLQEAKKRGLVPPSAGKHGATRPPAAEENAITHGLAVAGTGMYKGIADIAGLPDTMGRLLTTGNDKLRSLFAAPSAEETKAQIAAAPLRPAGMGKYANMPTALKSNAMTPTPLPVQQRVEDWIFKTVPKIEPKNQTEKYVAAMSRGASGGAIAGPVGVASGGISGLGSEGAGNIPGVKGTKFEPYARFIGGLLSGAISAYGFTKLTDAQKYVADTLRNSTPDDFAAAQRLMDDAQMRGTNLTATEALAQVQGGNSPLMAVQRYAENAPASSPQMAQFMSQRGPANQSMVGGVLDDVSPNQGAMPPTEVAPGINTAAKNAVNDVRKGINAEAQPFYSQAGSQNDQLVGYRINPYQGSAWDAVSNSPAFKLGLSQVRADPKYAALANLPDYDIEVLNAIKKTLGQSAVEAASPGIGRAADYETSTFLNQGKNAIKGTVGDTFPDYKTALEIGAEGRATKLAPAERAPIGQLATEPKLTGQQSILLPKLASDASPEQIASTVSTLVKQGATDQVQELIRLKLKDVFDTSLPNIKGSAEQFRGAQFANNVSRYDNQIKSLEAAIRQLPDGDATWGEFSKVLDILKAQGQRMPVGSPTEFNRLMSQQAESSGSLLSLPARAVQAIPTFARDAMEKAALSGYAKQLARVLTRPNGVQLLREMTQAASNNAYRQLINGLQNMQRGQLPAQSPAK